MAIRKHAKYLASAGPTPAMFHAPASNRFNFPQPEYDTAEAKLWQSVLHNALDDALYRKADDFLSIYRFQRLSRILKPTREQLDASYDARLFCRPSRLMWLGSWEIICDAAGYDPACLSERYRRVLHAFDQAHVVMRTNPTGSMEALT